MKLAAISVESAGAESLRSMKELLIVHHRRGRWFVFAKNRFALMSSALLAFILLISVFPGTVSSRDPYSSTALDGTFQPPLQQPTRQHPFGTDELGRDLFSRTIYGIRVSLAAGASVVAMSAGLGTFVGLLSAIIGGVFDEVAMGTASAFLAFPTLVVAVVLIGSLGVGLVNGAVALTLAFWPQFAWLARGMAVSVMQSGYVEGARSVGASWFRILRYHVLPNSVGPVLIKASLDFGHVVLLMGTLSFLGFGAQPPLPELGALVARGRLVILTAWWYATFPGLLIFVIVLTLNFIGDGLREAFDPTIT